MSGTTGVDEHAASGRRARRVQRAGPAWDAVALTTVVLALTIVLARVTGVVPVALASIAWFVAVAWLVVETARRRSHGWTGWSWVFVVGVGLAALRMCSLGLLQTVRGRSSLYWNVDGRFLATLARGIGRFGSLDDSLEYAGRPVDYHAGPSWIAGSLHHVFGVPIDPVLFVVVPLVCTLLVAWGGYRLLRIVGASDAAAIVGVVVALNLPRDPFSLADAALSGRVRTAFLSPSSWIFDATLMLNSVLGLAVALTAAWVVFDRRPAWALGAGCTAVACLAALKPQFLPVMVLVLGAIYLSTSWAGVRKIPWRALVAAGAWIAVGAAVASALNPQEVAFSGLEVHPVGAVRTLTRHEPFSGRIPIIAVVAIVVMVAVPRLRRAQPERLVRGSIGAAVAGLVAVMALGGTTMLLGPDLVRRANAVGLAVGRDWQDFNFGQGLILAAVILAMIAAAQLTVVTASFTGAVRAVPAVVVAVVLLAMVPTTVSALRSPTGTAAHEWTNEVALHRLLDRVDTGDGVWLSSDLADSADNHGRSLRAVNLTSLSDAQFYLSDVEYGGWAQPDVRRRLSDVQRFFDEPWSPWHDRFLRRHDIRHVVVRDRCPPAWSAEDFPGGVVARDGDWTLLAVGGEGGATAAPWPERTDAPGYGSSPCLAYPS